MTENNTLRMELSKGEWVFVGLLFVWASMNALGSTIGGVAGAYAGAVVLGVLVVGAHRHIMQNTTVSGKPDT